MITIINPRSRLSNLLKYLDNLKMMKGAVLKTTILHVYNKKE